MREIKSGKNNQKEVDRKSDIFQLGVPVLCPICNQKMHRRCNNSQRAKDRWACTSLDCKEMIIKADGEMIEGLTELLNMVIANPDIINIPSTKEYGEQREKDLDENKRYFAIKVDKNRGGNKDFIPLFEINLDYNLWNEVGYLVKKKQ